MGFLNDGTNAAWVDDIFQPSDWGYTLTAWVRVLDIADHEGETILGFASSTHGSRFMGLVFGTGSKVKHFTKNGGVETQVESINSAGQNTWKFVAARTNATLHSIYLDGWNAASSSAFSPTFDNQNRITIAAWEETVGLINPLNNVEMAEAAVWDTDLSDDQIEAIKNGIDPRQIATSNLRAYHQLREGWYNDWTAIYDLSFRSSGGFSGWNHSHPNNIVLPNGFFQPNEVIPVPPTIVPLNFSQEIDEATITIEKPPPGVFQIGIGQETGLSPQISLAPPFVPAKPNFVLVKGLRY